MGNSHAAWFAQRLSAAYLLGYGVFLVLYFALSAPTSYAAWRGFAARPAVAASAALFFLALALHAYLGVRDILHDYVHRFFARVIAAALSLLGYAVLALWALHSLWSAA